MVRSKLTAYIGFAARARKLKSGELTAQGKNPFTLDSKPATIPYREFIMGEVRYASLLAQFPEVADKLFDRAEHEAKDKYEYYKKLNDMQ